MDLDLPRVTAILEMRPRSQALMSYLYSQLLLLSDLRQYLFDLPENKRALLLSALYIRRVPEGELLFRKGDISDSLFILLQGTVGIFEGFGVRSPLIAQLSVGKVFGERGLVRKAPRLFTSRALSDTLVICLDAEDFKALLEPAFHARSEEKLQFIDRYLPGAKDVVVANKERLAYAFDMRYYHRGKRLAVQGRLTSSLYFIISGECTVSELHLGLLHPFVKLSTGSLLGDESVLLNRPSSHHVDVATEGTWLYTVSKEDALKFIPDTVLDSMRKQCLLKFQSRSTLLEKLHSPGKTAPSLNSLFSLANPSAKRRIVLAHRRYPSTNVVSRYEGQWSSIKQDLCHYTPAWPVQESPFARELEPGGRVLKRVRVSL